MARWPTQFPKATPHGHYGYARNSPADGRGCGLDGKKYPCVHPGLDLAGVEGTEVYAPENGTIAAVATGTLMPFRGYGPGVILIRGDSGVYHLFGHLHYGSIPAAFQKLDWEDYWQDGLLNAKPDRARVKEGQVIGVTSSADHVHWEVRDGEFGAKSNPAVWLKKQIGLVNLSDFTYGGAPSSGGGGAGIVILLALLVLDGGKRR